MCLRGTHEPVIKKSRAEKGTIMDITPIYDLRDRLRTAMIAGTNLLAEDFRLKRAVEAMAPLEKAAPVFAKVGELSRKLIAPDDGGKDGKEGILLDAITLTDALCCTQGVVAVSGELESVFADGDEEVGNISNPYPRMRLSNVPYSTLHPLQEALTTSGSGHYAYVTECHREHPELFRDYRVRVAMVQALGAAYAELADDVRAWLMEDGEDVIPLLMRGFDPKGKKEMVRRLHIIDKWMGAAANDFYIKQLETAEGELRQNLIYALRHEPKNVDLLLDLAKKERGNAKKIVYRVLACNNDAEVEKYFVALFRKKPKDVMEYLRWSKAPWAAPLAAQGIMDQLALKPEPTGDKKKDERDMKVWESETALAMQVLCCKSGPEVCAAMRAAADCAGKYGTTLQGDVLHVLQTSLILQASEEWIALANSIYEGDGERNGLMQYFPAAFLAHVIDECGGKKENAGTDWVTWVEEQFEKTPCVPVHFLEEALSNLMFYEDKGYAFEWFVYDDIGGYNHYYTRPVSLEIKGRFLERLISCNSRKTDELLGRLFDPSDKEVCSRMEEYFYKKALTGTSREYFGPLSRCGCTRCDGLLVHYVRGKQKLSMWEIEYYVRYMPGSTEAKVAEASKIPELVKSGKVNIRDWNEEGYMNWVQKEL